MFSSTTHESGMQQRKFQSGKGSGGSGGFEVDRLYTAVRVDWISRRQDRPGPAHSGDHLLSVGCNGTQGTKPRDIIVSR
ncbi:hypothetical protein PAXRUDRAFT_822186 [Paxillus rubicundulus Ve08.2h10]|uniref:Uncharacterized protein n=1 Tax=Paxillus rubicundulus Ve08.2h10 TaxID=930991 RepID=A0A0D0DWW0_9AGAM|nr:hypothetical protein PAXRUDRAFT_822186 [Paxillus rubicundulus Ve08.2h10]